MLQKKNHNLLKLAGLVIIWRVALWLVGSLAPKFVAYQPSFPYADSLLTQYNLPQWLYSWANFDGVHYITIAEKGYIGTGLIQAFFPIYPISMAGINFFSQNSIVSGLLMSNLALLLLIFVFFKFLESVFSAEVAWLSIVSLLLFPTSFYLGAVYSESLFLLLVVGTFYLSSQQKWWLAGVLAAFASATRVVGIFLVPALLWEALDLTSVFQQAFTNKNLSIKKSLQQIFSQIARNFKRHHKRIIASLLGCLGLISYMYFLFSEFRDPLYFLHVQAEFGAGREETIILLPQTVWRSIKIVFTVGQDWKWWSYLQDLLMTIFAFTTILIMWFKEQKINKSWLLFSLLAITLPTTTGTLSSMPRYILVAFPIFIWLGLMMKRQPRWRLVWIISGILLVINTCLFIQGYWVA